MDVHLVILLIIPGAGEQRRKKEDVRCPVCRAHWPYTSSLAPTTTPTHITAIVTVPLDGEEEGVASNDTGAMAIGAVGGVGVKSNSSPSHLVLSGQKMHLLERMKNVRE